LTLSKYRKFDNKVIFGMNLVCESIGHVKVGDIIEPSKTGFFNSLLKKF
jgi:hypothetical protein